MTGVFGDGLLPFLVSEAVEKAEVGDYEVRVIRYQDGVEEQVQVYHDGDRVYYGPRSDAEDFLEAMEVLER